MFIAALRTIWTFPTTAVGLGVGILCLPIGARWQFHTGVIEIHGGGVAWLLENAMLLKGGAVAITFGDCVLGRTQAALDMTREHERVHVRQAHCWGPFFIPAYLLASVVAWWRGQNAYRGNAFEIEAYRISDARSGTPLDDRL
ncbi:MAG TPA: hypothetical protein VM008_01130 [Phycisphaerae bacterium]|nr:hypothetical protein [Phycisphaerae bacterium]